MTDYHWPYLTDALRAGVRDQLVLSLSDRAGTGIIAEFEAAFAAFTGATHAVAFASGTAALHAMCVACSIGVGDSVLACAYGFPATVSPFAFAGARVQFCDADEGGGIDLGHAAELVDATTKAVVASHIWGNTEDCVALRSFCDAHGLILLHDGSHAHFAAQEGRHIAGFGHAAAYSLNQKAITSGEGGIVVTDDEELAARILLAGDYNHRCRTRPVPQALQPLVVTGQGLKSRPHPLALAVGMHELARAEDIERRRRANLATLVSASGSTLVPLVPATEGIKHGLYQLAFRARDRETAEAILERAQHADCESLDSPGATGLIAHLARFQAGGPIASAELRAAEEFRELLPVATSLSECVVKLPLWGYPGDEQVVDRYASLLQKC